MQSNAANTPALVLTVTGEITVDLEVLPTRLGLGELAKGEATTRPFTITVHEPDNAQLGTLKVEDERFAITSKSASEYELSFKGSATLGSISTKVFIEVLGQSPRTIELPVTARVVGDITHTRNLYFLKKDGAFADKEIKLTSRSGRAIKVLSITDPSGQLKVTRPKKPSKEHILSAAVVDPKALYKQHKRGAVVIKTDDKDMPELSITYTISEARMPVVASGKSSKAPVRIMPFIMPPSTDQQPGEDK